MPTSIKAAIKKWEESTGKKAAEARFVLAFSEACT
jgi:hypothetical protein